MNVLWITNTLFPDVCKELKMTVPVVGGWMFSGAKALLRENSSVKLAVASLYSGKKFQKIVIKDITYYLLPANGNINQYNNQLEPLWKRIQADFKPDVIHLHGSEYPHGLAYVRACGNAGVVLSVQGLVSVIERYFLGGISRLNILKNTTIRDIFRRDTLITQQIEMRKRGEYEKELIKNCQHVIGRTVWDKSHIWSVNPQCNYHFCNETLRDEFYKKTWRLDSCEKYSIFLSQGHYPIKGIQQVLKALPLILNHFPETKLYIAGHNLQKASFLKKNGFSKYVLRLIKTNKLQEKVHFTGSLNEEQMSERYLKSHVFVCPSSIENSPNSIGEAQLVGVPCVGAYVGGMQDMITHEETGLLYRFEEVEMLANFVCGIFSNPTMAQNLSAKGLQVAIKRHDKIENAKQLNAIYETICK